MTSTVRNRSRTFEPIKKISTKYRSTASNPGPIFAGSLNYDTQRLENDIEDTVTDNFEARMRNGEIINNPCTINNDTRLYSPGEYEIHKTSDPLVTQWIVGTPISYARGSSGFPIASIAWPSLSNPDLQTEARLQAIVNVDDTPYSFAEDIGEIRQTLKFLKDPLKSLSDLSKTFRKANRRKKSKLFADAYSKEEIKHLNDAFLTFRFAAAPLVRSAMSLSEALFTNPRRPKRKTARGSARDDVTNGPNDNTRSDFAFRWTKMKSIEAKAGILYQVTNPVVDVPYKYGLRLSDIPRTMWDLVPLSFMVDRIINIGNSISAVTKLSQPNLFVLAGWDTTKTLIQFDCELTGTNKSGYENSAVSNNTYLESKFTYERVPWTPTYHDAVPYFDLKPLFRDATSIAELVSLTVARLI